MDEAEQRRWANVFRWLREQTGRDLVVRCPDPHEDDAEHAGLAPGAEGELGAAAAAAGQDQDGPGSPVVEVVPEHCLGETQAWQLVDLAIAGGATVVVEACPKSDPAELGRLQALTAGRVRLGEVTTAPVARLQVAHPPVSRRGMLRRVAADPVTVHESDDPRQRLVESLRSLGVGEAPGEAPGLVLDAAACIACGVCVKACPHDALEMATAAGRTTLVQFPDRCQGERACVAACPSQVITVGGHHDWSAVLAGRPVPLARLATTRCTRCQITIPQGRDLCQPCADRVRDPFGVHLPDHLIDKLPATYRDRMRG